MEACDMRRVNGHRLEVVTREVGNDSVVVFRHGFLGSSPGPNRLFVRAARQLADHGVSSLRFDQFGSGNSEGEHEESSFTDWCVTIKALVDAELDRGRRVALFGQSMGASASIVVSASQPRLTGLLAWVPDPNIDSVGFTANKILEEAGQLVRGRYWIEAREANVAERLGQVRCPAFIVQCEADALVDEANRQAIEKAAPPNHVIDTYAGLPHSAWTYQQSTAILQRSVGFLLSVFSGGPWR